MRLRISVLERKIMVARDTLRLYTCRHHPGALETLSVLQPDPHLGDDTESLHRLVCASRCAEAVQRSPAQHRPAVCGVRKWAQAALLPHGHAEKGMVGRMICLLRPRVALVAAVKSLEGPRPECSW